MTLSVGELRLTLFQDKTELLIRHRYEISEEGAQPPKHGAKEEEVRVPGRFAELEVRPALPDRPVVVQVEIPYRLDPGNETSIFVRVPLWLQLFEQGSQKPLVDLPTVVLSGTWFGRFTEGELSYWISSSARTEIEPDPARPYLAITRAVLRNTSRDPLRVDTLCLRTAFLALYDDGEQLWSEVLEISYKGVAYFSQVRKVARSSQPHGKGKLTAAARETSRRSVTAKSFALRGELPGLGFRFR